MQFLSNIKNKLSGKQLSVIINVVLISILLGMFILRSGTSTTDGDEAIATKADNVGKQSDHQLAVQAPELPKGPHAGKLFVKDGYGLEVLIYQQNVAPHFRVYIYQDGKPLDPTNSDITINLERLGRPLQTLNFSKESDYLKSNAIIEEPFSFSATIIAKHAGKSHTFKFEQIEGRVAMTDRQLTLSGIEISTAGPANIHTTLSLTGEIQLNADKSVHVVPRLSGIVELVAANAGDKVRKGQVLAVISSQSIADQRSDLMAAQKRATLSQVTYDREKKLWEGKISAEQDYLQARQEMQEANINLQKAQQKLQSLGASQGSSNSNLTRYEIKAPIDGVITDKKISAGQVVNGDEGIFVVADLSTVWAEMTIYAKDISTVKVGQKVLVKASAFEEQTVGTVAYVSALVGEQSRTAMARIVLQNPKRIWLPGLPVNIELSTEQLTVPLAVSVEGLQTMGDDMVVFGRYGEYFEERPIELGRRDDKYVEVLHGLKSGEKYAAENSYLVKAELGKASASDND